VAEAAEDPAAQAGVAEAGGDPAAQAAEERDS